jgi:6-phospho-3-hexuloisomerase
MTARDFAGEVLGELERTLSAISPGEAEQFASRIVAAKKILVAGAGRSGLAVKAFAMRLMHMGFDAHVVGETVTPKLEAADLLLIGSGSGETGSLVQMARKTREIGGNIALVTIFPLSTIGQLADVCVRIPAPTPKVSADTGWTSIQPMGSLFEQSLFIFLDLVILRLMDSAARDSATMFRRHANLE